MYKRLIYILAMSALIISVFFLCKTGVSFIKQPYKICGAIADIQYSSELTEDSGGVPPGNAAPCAQEAFGVKKDIPYLTYCKPLFNVKIEFLYKNKSFLFQTERVDEKNAGSRDDLLDLIARVQSLGFNKEIAINYAIDGLSAYIESIKDKINFSARDAALIFMPKASEIFRYIPAAEGKQIDIDSLYSLIYLKLMRDAEIKISIPVRAIKPSVSDGGLKASTLLRGEFSTQLRSSDENRKNNIRLALDSINGSTVRAGEVLSFNERVGKRTEERGYKTARVIKNGVLSDGIGGGICQVSTTLYNAALVSGLKIDEWHRHSLKSGYVAPSFDAMVNESNSDLKIRNDTPNPIYVVARLTDDRINIRLYGSANDYQIKRKSVILDTVRAETVRIPDTEGKYAEELDGDSEFVLRNPIDGVRSEGYLEYYASDRLIKSKKIRSDSYKPQNGIIVYSK